MNCSWNCLVAGPTKLGAKKATGKAAGARQPAAAGGGGGGGDVSAGGGGWVVGVAPVWEERAEPCAGAGDGMDAFGGCPAALG